MRRLFGGRNPVRAARRAQRFEKQMELKRANDAFANGDFQTAAQDFETLAQFAENRGGPRAPIFHMQAARSRYFNNQTVQGLAHAQRAFQLFASSNRLPAIQRTGTNLIAELNFKGLTDEARNISALISNYIPNFESYSEPMQHRPVLPTRCPSCGAPVRSDEVEWIDDISAECDFCGSVIRAE